MKITDNTFLKQLHCFQETTKKEEKRLGHSFFFSYIKTKRHEIFR